jgi:hypothetical protein
VRRLLVTASVVPSSPILVNLMKEEPHGVTFQKTPFFKLKRVVKLYALYSGFLSLQSLATS